jgi:protein-disulfide isomerase
MGPPTARVKVVVFSDFQCPVCTRVVEPLKHLVRSYPDTVQVIFKHNALESHRYARQAAAASIAAFRQGKFWEYHDRLFQNQNALGEADLLRYAGEIGLDGPRFETDLKATDVAAQVAYETAMAEKLDMPGTPGFFINGERLAGWGSYSGFKGMIDRALEQAKGFQGEDAAQVATAAAGAEGQLLVELVWGAAR